MIFSLSAGTVLEAAIGRYKGKQTGENSLFRTLHDAIAPGKVVLADRYYSGWFDIALLAARGTDMVVRKHQLRRTDFRSGKPLAEKYDLDRTYISGIERGKRNATLCNIEAIAQALGISISKLTEGL